MEGTSNTYLNPLQYPTSKQLLKSQRSLARFLELRRKCMFNSKGKYNDREAWYIALVNTDKMEIFLAAQKTGCVKVLNDCNIINYGYGDMPKEVSDISVSNIIYENLIMMILHPESKDEILYVLSDPKKKKEIMEARSVEEIECHGTILYITNYLEPSESISFRILKRLFATKKQLDEFESTRIGKKEKIFNINSTFENGTTLLHQSSYFGNVGTLKNLVSKGADIHKKDEICGRLAVHMSALRGNIRVMEYFLNKEIKVNEIDGNGWTLLHYAAWSGDVRAIRYLIRQGSAINVKDKCLGKTPLMVGAAEGHIEAVKELLQNGALIDEVDDFGRTSIYYTSMAGYVETAKLLVLEGANIHISNRSDVTPLIAAVCYDNEDMVEFLISEGSIIGTQDNKGNTPLHHAAAEGFQTIVRFLVDKGANINAVNSNGETPFDRGIYYKDVASYLAAKLINYFLFQGNLDKAFKVSLELLKIQGDKLSSDQADTLNSIYQLAKSLYKHGQFGKSFYLLKNIDLENGLISNDYDALRTKCKLQLSINDVQCKLKEAVQDLKGILEAWETNLDVHQNDLLNAAIKVAHEHFIKGEYGKTFVVLQEALENSAKL